MSDEIHLWRWEYTDDFGKRRIYPCRLSGEDAKHYKDAEKIEGTLETHSPLGSNERLSAIAAQVHAGQRYVCAWDLF